MGSVEEVVAWREKRVGRSGYAPSAPRLPQAPDAQSPRRDPTEQLDLGQERAALARAQRETLEAKLAIQRGEYAPISLLTEVLASASQAVADRMDSVAGHLAKVCPHLSSADRAQVISVLNSARDEWVRAASMLVAARLEEIEAESEAAAEAEQ